MRPDSTDWVIAQFIATYTQANAAGGAIVVDLTPGDVASRFEVVYGHAINSGTNTLNFEVLDTGNLSTMGHDVIASGAGVFTAFPVLGSQPNATAGRASPNPPNFVVSGTDKLSIYQGAAGAQNDTLAIRMRMKVSGAVPTSSKARSTNQGNVSVTVGSATVVVQG